MRVVHLSLADFRNYTTTSVSLLPGTNIFVGSNGQGKTNLVESLGYLSSLTSHRVATDQVLIREGRDSAIIRAKVAHGGREVLVEVQLNRRLPNRAQINRGKVSLREIPNHFSSVLFAPEDLSLIRGEPSGRRRFIDQQLLLHAPRFAGVMADYDRVLRQRNSLLKTVRVSGVKLNRPSTLDIWDERLVRLGTQIIDARRKLIEDLEQPMRDAYVAIAGSDHNAKISPILSIESPRGDTDVETDSVTAPVVSVGDGSPLADSPNSNEYARSSDGYGTEQRFLAAIAMVRGKERERGMTLVGPHRDDVFFELNGFPAKGYASHGESWSFALALRLGSAQLLRRTSMSGDPVLILDDVFAELDDARRHRLADAVRTYEQVLVTAAVLDDVPTELRAHTVHILGGEITGVG